MESLGFFWNLCFMEIWGLFFMGKESIIIEKEGIDMKKKVLVMILIVLMITIVIFSINTVRKMMIIKDLQNKVAEGEAKENIYTKVVGDNAEAEKFIKDGVQKDVIKKKDNTVTLIQVTEEHERRFYTIVGEQKTLHLYKEEKNSSGAKLVSFVDTVTFRELLHDSIVSKIYTEEVDGQECYVIDSLKNTNAIYSDGAVSLKMYLSKDTGLAVRVVETVKKGDGTIEDSVTTYVQKFDVVMDEDMKEPDRSEFTIQED